MGFNSAFKDLIQLKRARKILLQEYSAL